MYTDLKTYRLVNRACFAAKKNLLEHKLTKCNREVSKHVHFLALNCLKKERF